MAGQKERIFRGDSLQYAGSVSMLDADGEVVADLTGWEVFAGLQQVSGSPATPAPDGYLALTASFSDFAPPTILIEATPVATATLALGLYHFQIRYKSPTDEVFSENLLTFEVVDPTTEVA